MKKRKVYWSIWNLTESTQKEVAQLQLAWEGLAAIITGATIWQSDSVHAIIVAGVCYAINKAIGCIYLEEIK
jgi:branched-subunit amino acid transport protein